MHPPAPRGQLAVARRGRAVDLKATRGKALVLGGRGRGVCRLGSSADVWLLRRPDGVLVAYARHLDGTYVPLGEREAELRARFPEHASELRAARQSGRNADAHGQPLFSSYYYQTFVRGRRGFRSPRLPAALRGARGALAELLPPPGTRRSRHGEERRLLRRLLWQLPRSPEKAREALFRGLARASPADDEAVDYVRGVADALFAALPALSLQPPARGAVPGPEDQLLAEALWGPRLSP